MVGYAINETESLMPPTFDKSRNIQQALWDIQHSDEMLDLDSKVQVTTGGDKANESRNGVLYDVLPLILRPS